MPCSVSVSVGRGLAHGALLSVFQAAAQFCSFTFELFFFLSFLFFLSFFVLECARQRDTYVDLEEQRLSTELCACIYFFKHAGHCTFQIGPALGYSSLRTQRYAVSFSFGFEMLREITITVGLTEKQELLLWLSTDFTFNITTNQMVASATLF